MNAPTPSPRSRGAPPARDAHPGRGDHNHAKALSLNRATETTAHRPRQKSASVSRGLSHGLQSGRLERAVECSAAATDRRVVSRRGRLGPARTRTKIHRRGRAGGEEGKGSPRASSLASTNVTLTVFPVASSVDVTDGRAAMRV
jgi:hypothetical protein